MGDFVGEEVQPGFGVRLVASRAEEEMRARGKSVSVQRPREVTGDRAGVDPDGREINVKTAFKDPSNSVVEWVATGTCSLEPGKERPRARE